MSLLPACAARAHKAARFVRRHAGGGGSGEPGARGWRRACLAIGVKRLLEVDGEVEQLRLEALRVRGHVTREVTCRVRSRAA